MSEETPSAAPGAPATGSDKILECCERLQLSGPDYTEVLSQINRSLSALVGIGQALLPLVQGIAKLSGVELTGEQAEAPAAGAAQAEPESDEEYALAVAVNHVGAEAVRVLHELSHEELDALVAAGRAGAIDEVRKLLGIA